MVNKRKCGVDGTENSNVNRHGDSDYFQEISVQKSSKSRSSENCSNEMNKSRVLKNVDRVPNLYYRFGRAGTKCFYVKCQIEGKSYTRKIDIDPRATVREMNSLVSEFITSLERENSGEVIKLNHTRKKYDEYLNEYVSHLRGNTQKSYTTLLKKFSFNEIDNAKAYERILKDDSLKKSSKKCMFSMIKSFFRWVNERYGIGIVIPIQKDIKTTYVPRKRVASDAELIETLNAVKAKNDRELLLFTLLLINYGVREGTAYLCHVDTLKQDGYHFYNEKRDRPYKYVIPAHSEETDNLFKDLSKRGYLWSRSQMSFIQRLARILKKFGKDDNDEYLTPHSLRHTFATRLAQSGQPMELISQLLDHQNVSITVAVYARYSNEQLKTAISSFSFGSNGPLKSPIND